MAERAETIESLYDDKIERPLQATLQAARELLPLLARMSDTDKAALRSRTEEYTRGRSGQEAFVPPDTLSAFPALFRNMEGLEGFFKVVKGEKRPLTAIEVAAATQRWEPFDQFAESAMALHAALKKQEFGPRPVLAETIATNSNALRDALGGRPRDGLFLDAVEKLQGVEREQTHVQTAQQHGDTSQTWQQIYDRQIKGPLDIVQADTEKLTALMNGLPDAAKQEIQALAGQYQQQCGLPLLQPLKHSITLVGPYRQQHQHQQQMQGGLPRNAGEILFSLPEYAQGVASLRSAIEAMQGDKTRELTAGEQSAAADPADAFRTLRTPVRALHAILNATNTDGRYDELLKLTAEIGAHAWEVQKAMDGPIAGIIPAAAEQYAAAPIMASSAASARLGDAEANRDAKVFMRSLSSRVKADLAGCAAQFYKPGMPFLGLDFTFKQNKTNEEANAIISEVLEASKKVGLEASSPGIGDNFVRVTFSNGYEKQALLESIADSISKGMQKS